MTTEETAEAAPNRGGRPPKPEAERLSYSYKQSTTGSVGQQLDDLATAAGQRVPEYVRDVIDAHLARASGTDIADAIVQIKRDADAQALADQSRISDLEAALEPFAAFGARPEIARAEGDIGIAAIRETGATLMITIADVKRAAAVRGN